MFFEQFPLMCVVFISTFHVSVVEVNNKDISGVSGIASVKHLIRVEVGLNHSVDINDDGIEEEDGVVLSDGEAVDVGQLGRFEAGHDLR